MSTVNLSPTVDVRRADDRFSTKIGWLDSKHSFSFGRHYDPRQHPPRPAAGQQRRRRRRPAPGFDTHPHRDMEIVTWVLRRLAGAPGLHRAHRRHLPRPRPADERRHAASCTRRRTTRGAWPAATAHRDPVHFVQMWVVPDESGITPGLRAARDRRRAPARRPGAGRLRHGQARRRRPRSASRTGTPRSTPRACSPARRVELPEAPFLHLFVPRGDGRPRGRGRAGRRATPSGSPPPAASRSPRPSRPRSWSGRCTPPSPADLPPSPDRRPALPASAGLS